VAEYENTIAYYDTGLITSVKSFTIQVLLSNVVKLIFFVSDIGLK
jgi:hypothetical protein